MGRADFFKEGDWNRVCDVCARKFKASDTKKQWNGLITCVDCWEPRHPQDHVRGKRDKQSPPWTRPQKTPKFAPADRFVHPFTAHLRFTGYRPRLLVDTAIAVGNASLNYTGHAPALLIDTAIAVGNASLTYTAYAPVVAIDQFIAVGNASLTYTGHAPVVDIDTVYVDDAGATYVDDAGNAYTDGT